MFRDAIAEVAITLLALAAFTFAIGAPSCVARANGSDAAASGRGHIPPSAATVDSAAGEIPMDLSTGRPIVLVALNRRGPFPFILDTGAGGSIVDLALAGRLGLPVIGLDSLGDPAHPSTHQASVVRVRTLDLGGVKLEGVTMTAFDIRKMIGPGYGGILGLPDLQELLVTLDFPRARLRAARGALDASDSTSVEYQSADGTIDIPIRVEGTTFRARLDTGSPSGFMIPRLGSGDIAFKSTPVEVGMAGTVSKTAPVWLGQLDGEIRMAGLSYVDPEVRLTDLHDSSANIGFGVLQDLRMTIDQRNHRLRLERTGTPDREPPAGRLLGVILSGMRPGAAGPAITKGGLGIKRIVPGSPAEQAGLLAGDVILSINGRGVKTLSPEEIAQIFEKSPHLTLTVRRERRRFVVEIN